MIATDMVVSIDDEDTLIALLLKDGCGDQSRDARPKHDGIKSLYFGNDIVGGIMTRIVHGSVPCCGFYQAD